MKYSEKLNNYSYMFCLQLDKHQGANEKMNNKKKRKKYNYFLVKQINSTSILVYDVFFLKNIRLR